MRRTHRLTAALTCLAITIGAIGVPMPASDVKQAKPSAERFPCENSPCGCADAAACWRDCCCKTHAEKLAWAKQNGVRPPAFVAVLAAAEAREAKQPGPIAGCCQAAKSCCRASQRTPDATQPRCGHCVQAAHEVADGGRIVLLVSALRCRGISIGVSLLPPALPPAPIEPGFLLATCHAAPLEAPPLYQPPAFDVATPPPDACG